MEKRYWVIEGETDCGYIGMAGHFYDNKRNAFRKLREVRETYRKHKAHFRLTEYAPKCIEAVPHA